MAEIGVSVSEIIEVRGSGFNVDELLALILIGCEQLSKTPTGVFTADHIIIYSDGSLRVNGFIFMIFFLMGYFLKDIQTNMSLYIKSFFFS